MDFLKVQASRIKEQLAGLTPSQRMLAGALVVIMVMTLLWGSRYAASSEMVDVLGQDLSPEDLSRITLKIAERGIESKTVGSRVQVPIERQREVLAMLTFERLTPQDMSIGFDDVVQKMNSPWNTDKMQDAMLTRAKEAALTQIMREWPDVREARVMINSVIKRGFDNSGVAPSASVNFRMRTPGSKPDKRLVAAAADFISSVVSGLNRSKVAVVIDGAPYSVPDRGGDSAGGASDSYIEMVKEGERYYSEKIEARLARYGGARVPG